MRADWFAIGRFNTKARVVAIAFAMKSLPLLLCLAASLHGGVPTPAGVENLRRRIAENFFVPDPLPALASITHRRFTPAPGVVAEAVTYTTQLGSRVPAIRTLPETHIGDWAKRTGMAMDKLYATEEREGGTRAIAEDVPGIAREGWSVFTAAEWEERRAELSFEGWTQRARAAGAKK